MIKHQVLPAMLVLPGDGASLVLVPALLAHASRRMGPPGKGR
jgi:hypothetical protein